MTARRVTRAAAVSLAALLAAAAPAASQHAHEEEQPQAPADQHRVAMQQTAFSPARLTVLSGDTVIWLNPSRRTHNVRMSDGGFDSGPVAPGKSTSHTFGGTGTHPYVCTIHPSMTGEVAVHPILLHAAESHVVKGERVRLHGRAAAGIASVTIEEKRGEVFEPVATAPVGADRSFEASVTPRATTAYRAVAGGQASPGVPVEVALRTELVLRSKVLERATRLSVRARPARPGARVVLQLRLRERFGWWPVARARLDRRSRATFHVRRHGSHLARVVITGADGATVLASSRRVRIRR